MDSLFKLVRDLNSLRTLMSSIILELIILIKLNLKSRVKVCNFVRDLNSIKGLILIIQHFLVYLCKEILEE